jgi:hypothetical protein
MLLFIKEYEMLKPEEATFDESRMYISLSSKKNNCDIKSESKKCRGLSKITGIQRQSHCLLHL